MCTFKSQIPNKFSKQLHEHLSSITILYILRDIEYICRESSRQLNKTEA